MKMKVIDIRRPPSDLAERFRELAVLADEGKITDAVVAYNADDSFKFIYGASLSQSIVLSSLLHHECIGRMMR